VLPGIASSSRMVRNGSITETAKLAKELIMDEEEDEDEEIAVRFCPSLCFQRWWSAFRVFNQLGSFLFLSSGDVSLGVCLLWTRCGRAQR
jgi:hypothetical protein